jgi:adenylyltransferase/sulfurtransferase
LVTKKFKELLDEEIIYYSRQIPLPEIGYKGQLKLKNSRICIAGVGGLGSIISLQLAAMGVGYIKLVDYDVVEYSNLHRQLIYGVNYLGYPKVEIAAKRLNEINPNVKIDPQPLAINEKNAEEIIKDVDVVVDGLDSMTPRYAINRATQKLSIPYVFGAVITSIGNASTILPKTTPCLECFQGNLSDEALPKCSTVGVHPSIINIISSIEVSETIRLLLGNKPNLQNKILHCDIENMIFEFINISKTEKCPVCGSQSKKKPMKLKFEQIKEICSRKGEKTYVVTPEKNLKLNIKDLNQNIVDSGYNIKLKAKLGVTFENKNKRPITLLKSGIMIIEDTLTETEIKRIYNKIVKNHKIK